MTVFVWFLILLRATTGVAALALCAELIRRLNREKLTRELLGENGMQTEILDGEIRSLFSEAKWLFAMWLTSFVRLAFAVHNWLIGRDMRTWDMGDMFGSLIVLSFTLHSAWVVWCKRRERVRLFDMARRIREEAR